MRKKGQLGTNKLLYMLPMNGIDASIQSKTDISITKEMAYEFEKLGAIIQGIIIRHKENGYSIIGTKIYSPTNELIYEKEYKYPH